MEKKRSLKKISVVIPCFNEEEVVASTYRRITSILAGLKEKNKIQDYEILFTDNCSTDATLNELKGLYESDPKVKVVALRRNFGYQGSISAGLSYSRGDATVTIDADLQDPPEKIEEMVDLYDDGYDLVLGVRGDRATDSFLKKHLSEGYYSLLRFLGAEIVPNHGDFRLMSEALVSEFNKLSERNRFIRGMVLQMDSRYAVVSYVREKRTAGRSKFGPGSLFSLSLDGMMSFSYMPLRIASIFGVLLCCMSVAGAVWAVYVKVTTSVIPGWTSTMVPIFLLSGFQLLFLGLIGEYIGRLYIEAKKRPVFLARDVYEHGDSK